MSWIKKLIPEGVISLIILRSPSEGLLRRAQTIRLNRSQKERALPNLENQIKQRNARKNDYRICIRSNLANAENLNYN